MDETEDTATPTEGEEAETEESKKAKADRADRFTWKQGDLEILPPRNKPEPEPTA